jgi:hypothetical protein
MSRETVASNSETFGLRQTGAQNDAPLPSPPPLPPVAGALPGAPFSAPPGSGHAEEDELIPRCTLRSHTPATEDRPQPALQEIKSQAKRPTLPETRTRARCRVNTQLVQTVPSGPRPHSGSRRMPCLAKFAIDASLDWIAPGLSQPQAARNTADSTHEAGWLPPPRPGLIAATVE